MSFITKKLTAKLVVLSALSIFFAGSLVVEPAIVQAANLPPTVTFSQPVYYGDTLVPVNFALHAHDQDGKIYSTSVNYENDLVWKTNITVFTGTETIPYDIDLFTSHLYTTPGSYLITYVVKDDLGAPATSTATVIITGPGPVRNLAASIGNCTAGATVKPVILTWDPPIYSDPIGYNVYRSGITQPIATVVAIYGATSYSYTDSHIDGESLLNPPVVGISYTYTVKSAYVGPESGPTSVSSVATACPPVTATCNMSATKSSGIVNLNWNSDHNTSCTITGNNITGTGSNSVSYSSPIPPSNITYAPQNTSPTTYNLSCAPQAPYLTCTPVSVTVNPSGILSFYAQDADTGTYHTGFVSVKTYLNGASNIMWTISNMSSCTIDNGWNQLLNTYSSIKNRIEVDKQDGNGAVTFLQVGGKVLGIDCRDIDSTLFRSYVTIDVAGDTQACTVPANASQCFPAVAPNYIDLYNSVPSGSLTRMNPNGQCPSSVPADYTKYCQYSCNPKYPLFNGRCVKGVYSDF